jgi:hypothetical protein
MRQAFYRYFPSLQFFVRHLLRSISLFSLLVLFLFACNDSSAIRKRNVDHAFYFWKSSVRLSNNEKKLLKDLEVNTLYIKFFDVDWNAKQNEGTPVAQARMPDSVYLQDINIIPVIFITNECIFKIDRGKIPVFAEKILSLTNAVKLNNHLKNINEIQIDCDWTAATKEKYFALLTILQQTEKRFNFSATIRLHQIKYRNKTGVPPVSRGMLMCYNMGNLTNISTQNSIIDFDELQKYTGDLQHYPLPLDVALPLFEWKVLFRKGKFSGLIENLPDSLMNEELLDKKENVFTVLYDTTFGGYTFKKNDIIRNEESKYAEVMKVANHLKSKIANRDIRVSLYHLDELILKKYSAHEMENIYGAMR